MVRRQPILAVTIAVMVLLASTSFPALAARKGGPGQQAAPWPANSFSAFGMVVSTDVTAGTMMVSVGKGSRLLKGHFDTDVTFKVSDTVKVFGFGKGYGMAGHGGGGGTGMGPGGMGQGGMGPGGMGYGGKKMTFAEVQAEDNVLIAGTFDSASSTYTVTLIKVWLY